MKKRYLFLGMLAGLAVLVTGLWGYRDIPLDVLKQKYAKEPSRFMNIRNMPVHFRVEGNPSDTIPLLLLHGTGASLHTWDGWVSEMQATERIIRLDLPAFGLTGPTADGAYSMEVFRDVVIQLLDSLGVSRVDIAGNSLGGYIAWYTALHHPERVRKLVLIDAVGYPIENSSKPIAFRLAAVPVINKIFTYITPRFIVRNSILDLYADKSKVSGKLVDRYFELSLRAGNRQAFLDRSRAFTPDSSYARISAITQPTLILWGEEDHFVPSSVANRFHDDLPYDTLVIMPHNGHMPMEESPVASAKIVMKFLESRK
jgi:pimeloyl-ACP methyl ester carboxylesterase